MTVLEGLSNLESVDRRRNDLFGNRMLVFKVTLRVVGPR